MTMAGDQPNVSLLVQEVHSVLSRINSAQEFGVFPISAPIDEISLLFADREDQKWFVDHAHTCGLDKFNESDDDMYQMDDKGECISSFGVHFDFIRFNSTVRIECMCVMDGEAPLHEERMQGNPRFVGVFHASYKMPTVEDLANEAARLAQGGYTSKADYMNSYGIFMYYQIEPHLPYFKPRVNMRDSSLS